MIELLLPISGIIFLIFMTGTYVYLLKKNKIEPYVPQQANRGNFWDAETKQFYKWDELMELKKEREKQND